MDQSIHQSSSNTGVDLGMGSSSNAPQSTVTQGRENLTSDQVALNRQRHIQREQSRVANTTQTEVESRRRCVAQRQTRSIHLLNHMGPLYPPRSTTTAQHVGNEVLGQESTHPFRLTTIQHCNAFLEDESTKIYARKVADHYSARPNQTLEEREASPIIHLKKLNNWIKSVLIHLYARRGDAVLDLACGKGGDLIKWDKAHIVYYVGIDIAQGSIEDCHTRYNGKKFTFPARLICGDCFEVRLDKVLKEDAPFDICSCQFAMHYSWSTEARARRALANVSALLRPGGIFIGTMPDSNVIIKKLREAEGLVFGNSVYWIRFDEEYSDKKFKSSSPFGITYTFHLEDAVDCPEWIVPFNLFKSLAEEYDLELVFAKNSHKFVDEYLKKPEFVELMRRLGALGDGNHDQSTLSPDEWEVAYLYLTYVLRKRGQPEQKRVTGRRDKGKMNPSKEDILYIGSEV